MDRKQNNTKILYKCITANTSAGRRHAAHTSMLHHTVILAAKKEPHKKLIYERY